MLSSLDLGYLGLISRKVPIGNHAVNAVQLTLEAGEGRLVVSGTGIRCQSRHARLMLAHSAGLVHLLD